jgi:hypothetical protein
MSYSDERDEIMRVVYCEKCDGYEVEWNGANERVPSLNCEQDIAEAIKACADAIEEIAELEELLGSLLLSDVHAPQFPH